MRKFGFILVLSLSSMLAGCDEDIGPTCGYLLYNAGQDCQEETDAYKSIKGAETAFSLCVKYKLMESESMKCWDEIPEPTTNTLIQ